MLQAICKLFSEDFFGVAHIMQYSAIYGQLYSIFEGMTLFFQRACSLIIHLSINYSFKALAFLKEQCHYNMAMCKPGEKELTNW